VNTENVTTKERKLASIAFLYAPSFGRGLAGPSVPRKDADKVKCKNMLKYEVGKGF